MHHHHDHNEGGTCHHHSSNPSVHQTLGELDFDRGIWSSALAGDMEDVERKLQRDSSVVNHRDHSGYTGLHYASRNGHLAICRLLIERGGDVNVTTTSTLATPLHRAAFMGHADIVSLLLANGATPGLRDCDGKTALDKATEKGHDQVVDILKTASVNAK